MRDGLQLAFIVCFLGLAALADYYAGYVHGQISVRENTVVRVGSPYYRGEFFGKCLWEGTGDQRAQYCATDDPEPDNWLWCLKTGKFSEDGDCRK